MRSKLEGITAPERALRANEWRLRRERAKSVEEHRTPNLYAVKRSARGSWAAGQNEVVGRDFKAQSLVEASRFSRTYGLYARRHHVRTGAEVHRGCDLCGTRRTLAHGLRRLTHTSAVRHSQKDARAGILCGRRTKGVVRRMAGKGGLT